MSVLVVGLSHKTAPVPVLERAALSSDELRKLLRDLNQTGDVTGTFAVSTCNRVEIYADVDRFHGGVAVICELLSRYSGIPSHELTGHLYVHYDERAVKHLLAVASGLDSMVVGESQILGQIRQALNFARENGTLGRALSDLGAVALRTGKRAHAETGIDRTGPSLVSVGIDAATARLGPAPAAGDEPSGQPLSGRKVLVVGAGSMSSLAATTAARGGAASIVVANRTRRRAERLAASVGGSTTDLADLPRAIADADLVISCTGASGLVITADVVQAALSMRAASGGKRGAAAGGRRLVLLDLAMPRDVDTSVGELPDVTVIGMDELADAGRSATAAPGITDDVAAVRAIVEEEFIAHRSAAHAARVTPTVVALRAKAAGVVDTELARLAGRLQGVEGLDGHALDEIARTVRRVVDKLLHAPMVRVKELAGSPGGDGYDEALRVLFDLDPRTVEAVARADTEQADIDSAQAPSRAAEEERR
ncbi:MAG TPA: glutamyl-tRNA reductase [Streptosporangiaceae bacterium]|nr:glutamyl-tRNA reductase [Streptosporangiaceae bacterium]